MAVSFTLTRSRAIRLVARFGKFPRLCKKCGAEVVSLENPSTCQWLTVDKGTAELHRPTCKRRQRRQQQQAIAA